VASTLAMSFAPLESLTLQWALLMPKLRSKGHKG
jgi:hypothetical protein